MNDLNQLLQRLREADIGFVIVGGYAAVAHGSSMLTRDLDVCADLSAANVEKLRAAFRDLHPTHRQNPQPMSFLDNPAPGVPLKNLYLQTDLGELDVMGTITGVGDFERVQSAAVEMNVFGQRVRVMSIDDLILAKEALGRDKDRMVAIELQVIREKLRR